MNAEICRTANRQSVLPYIDMKQNNDLNLPWKSAKDRYEFKKHNLTFQEVVGHAYDFYDAVGRISLNFNYLENEVSNAIIKVTGIKLEVGQIIVSELSFKNKLNLLGSLFQHYKVTHTFNTPFQDEQDAFSELLKACFKCEEFRNQILHSTFVFDSGKILRSKKSAKATKGFNHTLENVDSGYLLNISDHIYETGASVEEFFLEVKEKEF